MKVVTGEVKGITVSGVGKRTEKAHREGAHRQHRVCVETVVLAGSTQLFALVESTATEGTLVRQFLWKPSEGTLHTGQFNGCQIDREKTGKPVL